MRVKKKRRNNTLADLAAGMAESSDSSEMVTMAWRMEMAAVVVIVVVVQMFASISVQKPHRQTVEGGVEGVGHEQRHGLHVGACG